MKSKLYRVSRALHKYIGLALLLFIAWMSVSGILLNHPELLHGFSMPSWLVPPAYFPQNWNRSVLISGLELEDAPGTLIVAGKKGVWISYDHGRNFSPFEEGLPQSDYLRKSYDILRHEERLYLAAEAGLFARAVNGQAWEMVDIDLHHRPVKSLALVGRTLVVMTDSALYYGGVDNGEAFKQYNMETVVDDPGTVTLVDLFFELHSGSVWGLPGKLLFDVVGLISVFLCITAFYIWFLPWRRKKQKKNLKKESLRTENKRFNWHLKHHNSYGIWTAVFLLIISFTGIFMRPPLLAVIAEGEVDEVFYPSPFKPDRWHKKLHSALYEAERGTVLLATGDGFYRIDDSFSSPMRRADLTAPVFVMGTTVLEKTTEGDLLVGSFNGLYESQNGSWVNLLGDMRAEDASSVRPGEYMVTGQMQLADGRRVITTHEKGLVQLPGQEPVALNMPEELRQNPRLPLWNFMFELHNGRIFQDLIGDFYILLVPLGSILFFIIVVTGIIDWFFIRGRKSEQ